MLKTLHTFPLLLNDSQFKIPFNQGQNINLTDLLLLYSSGSSPGLLQPMDTEYVTHLLVNIYTICKHVNRQYYKYRYSGII